MYKAVACTEIGVKKKSNQDSCCVLEAETSYGPALFLAVCDGVGGLECGEVASSLAISRLSDWFEREFPTYIRYNSEAGQVNFNGLQGVWGQLFEDINASIGTKAHQAGKRMGTTCSCALIVQGQTLIGHVGDSRVYRVRQGQAEQLTKDQSFVAREVELGNLTAEQAACHPKRNVLLQALGTQDEVFPAIEVLPVKPDDCILICCDGFYHETSLQALGAAFARAATLSEKGLRQQCERLICEAMDAGETDNITVVCGVLSQRAEEDKSFNDLTSTVDLTGAIDLDETTDLAGAGCADDEATTVFEGENASAALPGAMPVDDEATVDFAASNLNDDATTALDDATIALDGNAEGGDR